MPDHFSILTVCTGNVCRSPLAEQLLAHALESLDFVSVSSAGTHAMVGGSMSEPSQVIARGLGIQNPELHQPHLVTEHILQESDLILAMDRSHKAAIVDMNPRVTKRVFTIREFARLFEATSPQDIALDVVADQPVERLQQLVASIGLSRGLVPPLEDPADADVIDPFRQSQDVYDQSARQLVPAVNTTSQALLEACTSAH